MFILWPTSRTLGMTPEDATIHNMKIHMHKVIHQSTVTAKDWEQSEYPYIGRAK